MDNPSSSLASHAPSSVTFTKNVHSINLRLSSNVDVITIKNESTIRTAPS
jgi:hypothetical protein